jgi:hypothetical protein
VRYSRDCDALAANISSACRSKISGSTLRRLLGFSKSNQTPRTYTLDIIATYIGHKDWDAVVSSLNKTKDKSGKLLTEITSENLKKGERFELGYKPDKTISIEHLGKGVFKVLKSKNSQLKEGDLFKAYHFSLHHPLFLLDVQRAGEPVGKIIEAKVSGLTHLKKMR